MAWIMLGQMLAACAVRVTVTVQCQACEATDTQMAGYVQGAPVACLETAEGWRVLDGKPYCPAHTIDVRHAWLK